MYYTQAALQKAFNSIANPSDWRAPICAKLPVTPTDFELVRQAIMHFTATTPMFKAVGDGRHQIQVNAIGYRQGPAGP